MNLSSVSVFMTTFPPPFPTINLSPQVSNPTCTEPPPGPQGGPFNLVGTRSPAMRTVRAGTSFRVTFALSRFSTGYRRNSTTAKVWEDYDMLITLPEGATLKGKPRVAPRIHKRKGPDTADNTLIAWNQVPMRVLPGVKKNCTRKFSFAVRVGKTFVGDLTFVAAATGPEAGWLRETTLTVPVTRK